MIIIICIIEYYFLSRLQTRLPRQLRRFPNDTYRPVLLATKYIVCELGRRGKWES